MKTKKFRIIEKRNLAPRIKLLSLEAPLIAARCRPGQFVVIRINEEGERIPLTIACYDAKRGSITIVVQDAGRSTGKLCQMEKNQFVEDVLGPLGIPTPIKKVGTVLCVGGGVGVALLYPEAKKHKEIGNEVISIMGARTKELMFFQEEMEKISNQVHYSTDDGSFGHHGFVTDLVRKILESGKSINEAIVIGPIPMMKAVCHITKEYKIKTIVSLNPIMLDATGMCGSCRVKIGGQTKFACVDGPDFDGHLVDFDELMQRQKRFVKEEKIVLNCRRDPGEK